jgi:hypothetical protein
MVVVGAVWLVRASDAEAARVEAATMAREKAARKTLDADGVAAQAKAAARMAELRDQVHSAQTSAEHDQAAAAVAEGELKAERHKRWLARKKTQGVGKKLTAAPSAAPPEDSLGTSVLGSDNL